MSSCPFCLYCLLLLCVNRQFWHFLIIVSLICLACRQNWDARLNSWEQGWRSGESARLPPMCPRFDSRTRRHMWVEFVVGSLLCSERFFSGYSGFLLSSKTNISKFQFDPGMHGHFWTSSCELLGAPWVNKLLYCYFTLTVLATKMFDAVRTVSEGPVGDGRPCFVRR